MALYGVCSLYRNGEPRANETLFHGKVTCEGTPEGVRVTIYGVVEAAPKPVNNKRGSPLQLFLVEYDPKKPDEPLRHEIWARSKVREEVTALRLKKGDCIEAVLYRHTWEVEL